MLDASIHLYYANNYAGIIDTGLTIMAQAFEKFDELSKILLELTFLVKTD